MDNVRIKERIYDSVTIRNWILKELGYTNDYVPTEKDDDKFWSEVTEKYDQVFKELGLD